MNALIAATMNPAYPARIIGVISNKEGAPGLAKAEEHSIETRAIPHKAFKTRAEHDAAVDAALREMKADIVCLAGYMRLLTEEFVLKWQGRLINIHPALLPSFKGVDTHERALAAGVRIHGCTVHFVTAEMDDGPIIMQAAVPVCTGDTEAVLSARVLKAEHRIYPEALALVATGAARMANGRVIFRDAGAADKKDMLLSPDPRD